MCLSYPQRDSNVLPFKFTVVIEYQQWSISPLTSQVFDVFVTSWVFFFSLSLFRVEGMCVPVLSSKGMFCHSVYRGY